MKRVVGVIVVNIYSFSRAAAVYPLIILTENDMWGWASLLFAFMLFTDITDGPLADLLDGRTKVGAILDLVWDTAMAVGVGITLARTLPYGWYLFGTVVLLAGIFQPMLMIRYLKGTLASAIAQVMMVVLNVGTCLVAFMVYTYRAFGGSVIIVWLIAAAILISLTWWRKDDKIKGEWLKPLINYFGQEPLS